MNSPPEIDEGSPRKSLDDNNDNFVTITQQEFLSVIKKYVSRPHWIMATS